MKHSKFLRIAAVLAGLSLVAAACGDDDDTATTDDTGTPSGEVAEYSLAFVGPLTGRRRQPGHLHPRRRRHGRRGVQRRQRRHRDHPEGVRHPGRPDAGARSVRQVHRRRVDPRRRRPRLLGRDQGRAAHPRGERPRDGQRLGHQRRPRRRSPGSSVFHRVLPDDAAQAAGIVEVPRDDAPARRRSRSSTTTASTGRAWPSTSSPRRSPTGIEIVATEAIDPKGQDYSAAVNAVKAAEPDAVFFGGYYEAAGRLKKQLTDAGVHRHVHQRRRCARRRLRRGRRGRGRRRRAAQLPVLLRQRGQPGRDRRVRHRLRGAHGNVPGTYSTEALRRRQHPDERHPGRATPTGPRCSSYVEGLTTVDDAISKEVVFAGERQHRGSRHLRVQGGGREDRPRDRHRRPLGRRHQTNTAGGRLSGAPSCCVLTGSASIEFNISALVDQFWAQTVDGLTLGLDLRPDRPRLHARLRRAPADQLRPLRDLRDRHLRDHVRHRRHGHHGDPPAALSLILTLGALLVIAMAASGLAALVMERVAYRPLRRRNAPRLTALITAIGISLVVQEFLGLRYGRAQISAGAGAREVDDVRVRGAPRSAPTRCS